MLFVNSEECMGNETQHSLFFFNSNPILTWYNPLSYMSPRKPARNNINDFASYGRTTPHNSKRWSRRGITITSGVDEVPSQNLG
jgi:hypothetical protein